VEHALLGLLSGQTAAGLMVECRVLVGAKRVRLDSGSVA
jgi:hypothetical protein